MMAKKSRQRWQRGRRRNSSQRDDSESSDDDEEKKTPLVKWGESPAKLEAWQEYIETRCREDGFALCILICWFTDPDPERAEMEETILRRSSSIGLGDRTTNIGQLRRATIQVKNAQNAMDVISSRYHADMEIRRSERNIIWQENETNDKRYLEAKNAAEANAETYDEWDRTVGARLVLELKAGREKLDKFDRDSI